jgi:NTP pyrophosphatase (non-canonical NTP hydrolase)
VAKGWWDGIEDTSIFCINDEGKRARSLPEQIALMHSELSEALEAIRIDDRPYHVNEKGKPEGWGVELADCVIRIMDTCQHYDVDLQGLVELKMRYNETRPHRHGGKKL